MVQIDVRYLGELRCEARHGPSSATLLTDAPVDNHGRGQSFSPTDLVATALGTCMATIMGIAAAKHGIELAGLTVTVEKHMVADPDRRIGRLTTTVRGPGALDERHRRVLEGAALACPVHRTLGHALELPVTFRWDLS